MHLSILRSEKYFFSFFILLSAAVLTLHSCTVCSCKTVPCPAYANVSFDAWFPYDSGQVIEFKSTGGITDTITIGQIETTSAYDAQQGCYHSDNGCNTRKYIYGSGKMTAEYFSSADWNGKLVDKHCFFQLYDFVAAGSDISDTGIVFTTPPPNYRSQYITALTLNGKTYNNLQVFERDSASLKENIYKVYIARDIGLLAYEYYPAKILFIKK